MDTVDLYECSRCHLLWVDGSEAIPGVCPSCRLHHSVPKGEVIVAGRDVRVNVVRDYGLRECLLDPQVRRGLDVLELGHCRHGFIASILCRDCNREINIPDPLTHAHIENTVESL